MPDVDRRTTSAVHAVMWSDEETTGYLVVTDHYRILEPGKRFMTDGLTMQLVGETPTDNPHSFEMPTTPQALIDCGLQMIAAGMKYKRQMVDAPLQLTVEQAQTIIDYWLRSEHDDERIAPIIDLARKHLVGRLP